MKLYSEKVKKIKLNFKDTSNLSLEEKKAKDDHEKEIKKLFEHLEKIEKYNWDEFFNQIKISIEDKTFWKKNRSNAEEEKQELETLKKFISCLFPDERSKDFFKKKEIDDISVITSIPENYVVSIINDYRLHLKLHEYAKIKQMKKLAYPTNQEAMIEDLYENYPELTNYMRQRMYDEIKNRLKYSNEYVRELETQEYQKIIKSTKRTWQY